MRSLRLIPILLVLGAITGCGAPPPGDDQQSSGTNALSKNPVPPLAETVRSVARADLLPPNVVIGSDSPSGGAETIAFDSREPLGRLLAWYRAAERDFKLGSEFQEGAEYVLSGSTLATGRDFTIRLAPGRNGGTSGMILFTDR